jgi:hypothetical protein
MARGKSKFSPSLSLAIAIIGVSAIQSSALASPQIVAQVESRAIALPSSNSHYDDDEIYYRDRDYRHNHHREHKSEGVTVIINTPGDRRFSTSDNYYIRIIRE